MKSICVIKSTNNKTFHECKSVQEALELGKELAMGIAQNGQRGVTLEVYELAATGAVETTSTIKIEKAVKP